jgi:glycosyltransferase involved in cell wall biosynthesis
MTVPLLSIIIPARNEENCLPICLKAIQTAKKSTEETVEVIVIINRCTDNTEQIARDAGCRILHNDSKNLSKLRNAGGRLAEGRILVTIDADSSMSPNLLKDIISTLSSGKYIGGAVLIWPERWSLGILFSLFFLLAIAVWYRISGGVFFCYRDDFVQLGGFNEELLTAEDIDFARRLKKYGQQKKRNLRFSLDRS